MASILTVVGLTAALHVAGAFPLKYSFWGVHFYGFFAPALLTVATALLLGTCVFVALKSGAVGEWLSSRPRLTVWSRLPATSGALVASGCAALLWLARTRNTYLGDGSVLINSLPAGQSFHPYQPLTMLAQQKIYRLAAGLFEGGDRAADRVAQDTAALGSVVLGVLFVGAVWLLARELVALATRDPERSGTRDTVVFLTTLVLLAQGYIQLFFGYVENYTFYALATALYLWLSLRYLRGVSPLVLPAAAMVLGIAFHLSAAVLVPSFLVLVVHGLVTPDRRVRTIRDLVITAAVLFGVDRIFAALQPGYRLLSELGGVAGLALTRGAEGAPGYMLSSFHLRDFFNEQFLIGPLGIFVFVPAAVTILAGRGGRRVTSVFLVVAGATYLGVSWLAGDSNLGYARNWDLLAPGALVATVSGLGLFLSLENGMRRAAPVLVCAALVSLYHTVPWVATNASAGRSLERLKTLPLGHGRTEVLVGKWHSRMGSLDDAQRWFERAIHRTPRNNNAHYLLGLVHWDKGDMPAAAKSLAEAARLRPDKVLFRERLIQALRASGRYQETLVHTEFVLQHKPTDVNQWIYHGEALQSVDRDQQARAAFEKALSLYQSVWEGDPAGFRSNLTYGMLHGNLEQYEKALPYFERALEAEPGSDTAHYYAGYTLYVLDRTREANTHFLRCLEINPEHPERADMEKWLEEGDALPGEAGQ